MLAGLPWQYKPIFMGLESSGTVIKGEFMKAKLLQAVHLISYSANTGFKSVFFANRQNYTIRNIYSSRKPNNKFSKVRCYKYNKYGYFAKECRSTDNMKERRNSCTTPELETNGSEKNVFRLGNEQLECCERNRLGLECNAAYITYFTAYIIIYFSQTTRLQPYWARSTSIMEKCT